MSLLYRHLASSLSSTKHCIFFANTMQIFGGNIVFIHVSGTLRVWDRPCLTQLLSHVSSCSLCCLTDLPLLENKQSVTCALSPWHSSDQDSPLPLGCPWCSRWSLWCEFHQMFLSKNRHLVPLLYRHETPVVLGFWYSYTLLFHRCIGVTQL